MANVGDVSYTHDQGPELTDSRYHSSHDSPLRADRVARILSASQRFVVLIDLLGGSIVRRPRPMAKSQPVRAECSHGHRLYLQEERSDGKSPHDAKEGSSVSCPLLMLVGRHEDDISLGRKCKLSDRPPKLVIHTDDSERKRCQHHPSSLVKALANVGGPQREHESHHERGNGAELDIDRGHSRVQRLYDRRQEQ